MAFFPLGEGRPPVGNSYVGESRPVLGDSSVGDFPSWFQGSPLVLDEEVGSR